MHDLQTGGTYENVDGHSEALKHTAQSFTSRFNLPLPPFTDTSSKGILDRHALFKSLFGIKTDVGSQSIPFYSLTRKMHKDPIGARFISSSENSLMLPISKGLCGLLQFIQGEVGVLFSTCLQSMSIAERWTARSWVITDVTQFIPLIHVWNAQYAAQSPDAPELLAMDCERLYTKIDLQDLKVKVLDMIARVFNSPEHTRLGHVGVKVRETKHAQWLKAHEIPADYHKRTGTADSSGDFVIFDLAMIEMWVTYLLDNLFIKFGSVFARQAIGAPMGANCSGELVNLYVTCYELLFVEQLCTLHKSPSSPPQLVLLTLLLQRAFLLTSRYLDDICSINNPYFQRVLYNDQFFPGTPIRGIYPPQLNIKTADSGTSVNFLSITIQPAPHRIHRLSTIHKRFVPPMSNHSIDRFPHMSSNILEEVKYNIVVGFFHSFRREILDRCNFVDSLADVILYCSTKGYDVSRMLQDTRRCCLHHPELFGTTPMELYNQIRIVVNRRV